MFLLIYINVQKITHLAQNVKYFSYPLDDSFSQLSKEVRLLCWDSRKSKQRKWSDIFQKIQVDINFILICGTKLRTFKQKVRPQWILLWCIFMWKKLGTNLSTPWKIYSWYHQRIWKKYPFWKNDSWFSTEVSKFTSAEYP